MNCQKCKNKLPEMQTMLRSNVCFTKKSIKCTGQENFRRLVSKYIFETVHNREQVVKEYKQTLIIVIIVIVTLIMGENH